RRLLAERRLLRRRRRDDQLAMRMRRRDDHDRVNERIVEQRTRLGIVVRHVELGSDIRREPGHWIGHGDESRLGDARREVARVYAAQAAEAGEADGELPFSDGGHFTLSFVTSSSRTLTSAGSVSPLMTFTALSTATRPISAGNCATEAAIFPAAIAFFASSSASNPTTRILPVFPAAAIASIAPRAIRSLHAKTLSIYGC